MNPGSAAAADALAETPVPGNDPFTRVGWNGPYLSAGGGVYTVDAAHGFGTTYGLDNDPAVLDGWHHPVVLVVLGSRAWPQSAGPNGVLEAAAYATQPPAPLPGSGVGSVFPTAAGSVTRDDLTFVVY